MIIWCRLIECQRKSRHKMIVWNKIGVTLLIMIIIGLDIDVSDCDFHESSTSSYSPNSDKRIDEVHSTSNYIDTVHNYLSSMTTKRVRSKQSNWRRVKLDNGNKTLLYPKFSESSFWSQEFPNCNSKKNSYLSPININTKDAIKVVHKQTLFVYSTEPIRDYVLSVKFLEEPGIQMDLMHLKLRAEKFHEATYVTGLGDSSYRFFEYAVFLFAKDQTDNRSGLSTHQINGKGFPMEIILLFSTRGLHNDEHTTQIHVLVEVSEVDNPLFVPVVLAAKKINERIQKTAELEKTFSTLNQRCTKLKNQLVAAQNKTKNDNVQQKLDNLTAIKTSVQERHKQTELATVAIQQSNTKIKRLQDELDKNKLKFTKIKDEFEISISIDVASLDEISHENGTQEHEAAKEIILARIDAKQSEMSQQLGRLNETINRQIKDLDEEKVISSTLKTKKAQDIALISKVFKDRNLNLTTFEELEAQIKRLTRSLDFKEDMEALTNCNNALHEAKMKLTMDMNLNVKFQVSWLMPPVGGHYLYNGSLPIPPCSKRGYTLILETPVVISREQFEIISSISQPKGGQPLDNCLPPLAHSAGRSVWYNKKNLQFILDDSIHMKSKKRKKLKDQNKQNIGHFLSTNLTCLALTLMLISKVSIFSFCPISLIH